MEHLEIIDGLIIQFEDQRKAILDMIVQLEDIKKNIDILIPNSLDKRYIRFFEEKVKTITNLFNTLLEMRKEISKNLREEIEIRRKIIIKDNDFDLEGSLDIRRIARKVESFKEKTYAMKKKLAKTIEDAPLEEGVEIPGVTVPLSKNR